MRWARSLISLVVALRLATVSGAPAQLPGGDTRHQHPFECLEDGLTRAGATGVGCQLLAKLDVPSFPNGALFWHLAKLPTRDAAALPEGEIAFAADAHGEPWLFTFGPKDAAPSNGEPVASVGPLRLTPAKLYQVVAYYVVMPAGAYTIVHTHPGPEAWFVLAGTQCLETPGGAMRVAAGQGGIAPPDTPMRLSNPGTTTRRALFIVIHDAARAWTSPSDWPPPGACER